MKMLYGGQEIFISTDNIRLGIDRLNDMMGHGIDLITISTTL